MSDALVMIGGMNLDPVSGETQLEGHNIYAYPFFMLHGVMNLLNPYPHTFLLTVILTNKLPATGL